ncbi:hypothetical protein SUDANB96_03250 [Streptomyces sp. enrichment culture]
MGVEAGALAARSRALAVLRVRGRALALALLPAAAAVILWAGGATDHLVGSGWDAARWAVSVLAAVVLLVAGGIALVVARARPALSPTVPITEEAAPDLYRLVRDLADRLDVPAPSAIALTPDCDSWLEDRTHPAHGPPAATGRDERADAGRTARRASTAPVLVIGSPFLWWMRVGELRAVLAPVVAGTGPSAHPDIAAARRFVRGLDAAVAVASAPARVPLLRPLWAGVGWVARLMLRGCRQHAVEMERGVAAAAAERAQAVDYGLRIVAQEQVGLAYAGWDRLLTRVALPAWRMGRWPSRLDAGVVAALTELSRRDRLAEGFTSRLGERPACDLLEEPGAIDEAASLLAARLFHGGPAEPSPDWAPVDWQEYPEEVVDRKWRTDAARLHRVLDTLGVRRTGPHPEAPTLNRVLDHLTPTEPPAHHQPDPSEPTVPGAPVPDAALGITSSPEPTIPGAPAPDAALGHTSSPEPTASGAPVPDSALGVTSSPEPTAPGTPAPDAALGLTPSPEPSAPGTPAPDAALGVTPSPDATAPTGGAPTPTHAPPTDSALGPTPTPDPTAPTGGALTPTHAPATHSASASAPAPAPATDSATPHQAAADGEGAPQGPPAPDHETRTGGAGGNTTAEGEAEAEDDTEPAPTPRSTALAECLHAELAREEAQAQPTGPDRPTTPGTALWDDDALPLFPLQPPRSPRELLADHITAMICCAAIDTAGATPGLDWLDGPSLLVHGERATDLAPRVLTLLEDGDPTPLRAWLTEVGIRPEKPVRLV